MQRKPSRQKLIILIIGWVLICLDVHAARKQIASGNNLCADLHDVCFSGNVIWNKNDKLISISAKLKKATEPGEIIFWFSGFQGSGEQVFMDTKIAIRGKSGEHFSKRIVMPYSSETIWSLQRISFQPESEESE